MRRSAEGLTVTHQRFDACLQQNRIDMNWSDWLGQRRYRMPYAAMLRNQARERLLKDVAADQV